MKFIRSLWVLTDNDAMDVTQIDSPVSIDAIEPPIEPAIAQPMQPRYDYSNIINMFDYLKVKNPAF